LENETSKEDEKAILIEGGQLKSPSAKFRNVSAKANLIRYVLNKQYNTYFRIIDPYTSRWWLLMSWGGCGVQVYNNGWVFSAWKPCRPKSHVRPYRLNFSHSSFSC
jgi:hypothetical protein